MTDDESKRESFLRNHQENIRTMRAVALRLEREGNATDAARVRAIVETWEAIAEQVGRGEADDRL
jgi:hypothetical protein